MTLGTISICMTVCVLNVHHRGTKYPVPKYLKRFFFTFLAKVVCVRITINLEDENTTSAKHRLKIGKRLEGNGAIDDFELIGLTVNSNPTALQQTSLNGPGTPVAVGQRPKREITFRRKRLSSASQRRSNSEAGIEPPDYSREWHELAHVLDRFFFWILFICMTVSAVFTLLYPKYSGIEATWGNTD